MDMVETLPLATIPENRFLMGAIHPYHQEVSHHLLQFQANQQIFIPWQAKHDKMYWSHVIKNCFPDRNSCKNSMRGYSRWHNKRRRTKLPHLPPHDLRHLLLSHLRSRLHHLSGLATCRGLPLPPPPCMQGKKLA